MPKQRARGTKEKLLTAASEVFVEKGYRDATVMEICNRADANVAAVNYHFGSKEALYKETWRYSFSESVKTHPQDGGVSINAPAEERLRGQVKALIERISDANNRDFLISQIELVNPTGLLQEVMISELIPLREQTLAVMRELLGSATSTQEVLFCEISIISMCIHPLLLQRAWQRANGTGSPFVIEDISAYVDHVMTFALAGIAAVRGDPPLVAFAGPSKPGL